MGTGFYWTAGSRTLDIDSNDYTYSAENGVFFSLRASSGQEKNYYVYFCGINLPNPVWNYDPLQFMAS